MDGGSTGTDLTQRQTLLVFSGMLVSTFLSSLDGTAVSTALPTIAGELGGIDQVPWVLTAYLLGSVAATPLYGKLSDLHGRRVMTEVALAVPAPATGPTAVSSRARPPYRYCA